MSTEAVRRRYLFLSKRLSSNKPHPVFFNNVLHDMESIVWSIFSSLVDAVTEEKSVRTTRNKIIEALFSGTFSKALERQMFLAESSESFDYYFELLGEKHDNFLQLLSEMIETLVGYYRNAEKDITYDKPIDVTKFHGIHKAFRAIWARCVDILREVPISLSRKEVHQLPEPISKRKRNDDESVAQDKGSKRRRKKR